FAGCREVAGVARLGERSADAAGDGAFDEVGIVDASDDHDRPPEALTGQLHGRAQAVETRHLDVEEVEVGAARSGLGDGLLTVADWADWVVPKRAQTLRETHGDDRAVFGDQDLQLACAWNMTSE